MFIRGKAKVLDELRASRPKRAGKNLPGPDPDREGRLSPGISPNSALARAIDLPVLFNNRHRGHRSHAQPRTALTEDKVTAQHGASHPGRCRI